jgi:hypothetical protein
LATVSGGGTTAPVSQEQTILLEPLPPFAFKGFTALFTDNAGDIVTQSGGHPDITTHLRFNTKLANLPTGIDRVKDVDVDLPVGLVGNPTATSELCTFGALTSLGTGEDGDSNKCPAGSQVGVVSLEGGNQGFIGIYNMVPRIGSPAQFGFVLASSPVILSASLRDGDHGARITSVNTNSSVPVTDVKVTFWGVPADPSHDFYRKKCMIQGQQSGPSGDRCTTGDPRVPFTRLPTECGGALPFAADVSTYGQPNHIVHADTTTPPLTGCGQVPFEPEIDVQPTTTEPDSPSGLRVDVTVPQENSPDGIATADLRRARVTLPEGMTVSPSSASGLAACSDQQFRDGLPGPSTCPAASTIGSVSLDTPLLEEPVAGKVFVLDQLSDDPGSGRLFRLGIELRDDDRGVDVKLPGSVIADPQTGQLTTTFDETPQLPFSRMSLRLKGGPRAPLATPATCGTKTVITEMTGWNGKVAAPSDSFTIDCPGMSGFAPSFEAGAVSPTGGAFSPFVVAIERRDREEYLDGVEVEMPKGVLAKLRGVPLCADAQAASGGCPAGSRVGTATVGAGAGSTPFYLDGPVYLTGPYKGAPYGLSVAVSVVAGPYDLGTVVVRQALHVDRDDAHVTVVSDPLPRVLKGVPVRLRSVNVDVDRPGFTVNPTSCSEKQVVATLRSQQGTTRQASSRFQVGDCQALAFRPKLKMRLTGKRQRRTGGHPGIRAVLTQGSGQAGIGKAEVRLPSSLALDTKRAASDDLCEWRESLKDEPNCPAASVIGRAKAVSPLLNRPLEGPVYFAKRKRINRFGREISTFPSLVIALRGEVAINLRGNTTVKPGALVTTFAEVPDAPISRFELNLAGARKGILLVTKTSRGRNINLCSKRQIAEADIDGQNGRRADQRIAIKTPCAKKAKRAKR